MEKGLYFNISLEVERYSQIVALGKMQNEDWAKQLICTEYVLEISVNF